MKKFSQDFILGVSSYRSAFQLIKEKKLWHYFVLPILLSLGLAIVLFLARIQVHHFIEQLLKNTLQYDGWWEWARWITSWLIHLSLFLFSWYLYYKFQKYVLFIVLSPVLAFVSEKTEEALSGKKYSFNLMQFLKDIVRGVALAFRNLFYEFAITFLLFLLGLIPIFTPFTGFLILFVGWYYYGYAVMDYSNERKKLSISEGNQLIKQRKGIALANGMVFEIIFMIPIVGFVFAPILSTVAGTISMHKK